MASPFEATPAWNYNMAIKELEKGCELTAMLRSQLGTVLNKDGTDSQFGYLFEEISHTLAFSREILTKSDQNMHGSKVLMTNLQPSEGAKTNKRKRDDTFKNCPRRKCNNTRMELTPTPFHDGYQWRKYGQKNILNQKYPRCYYRCTYHSDRNCIATKQVQQYNDECLPLFKVAYFHEHTCNTEIPSCKTTMNQNILDFSGKSIPEYKLSTDTMFYSRQDEDAALLSCLNHVVRGYNSGILENSNGTHNQLNTSNECSSTIDDDVSSIESTLLRQEEFPLVHGMTMDLEWLEQDPIQFFLGSLPPISI